MNLIPLFKSFTREELSEQFAIECGISEWVSIDFPYDVAKEFDPNADPEFTDDNNQVSYETNRYDATYFDKSQSKNLSVFVYMDEDSEQIIAIDGIVQDRDEDVRYYLNDTPIGDVVSILRAKSE